MCLHIVMVFLCMLFKLVEPLKGLVNHVFALRVVEAEPELNPLGLWHGMERCRGPTSEGTSKCALLGMTCRTSPLVSALVDQADLGSDTRRVKRLPSPQAVSVQRQQPLQKLARSDTRLTDVRITCGSAATVDTLNVVMLKSGLCLYA